MPMLCTEQATTGSVFRGCFLMAWPMRSIVSSPKRSTVWGCITTSAKACLRTMKRRQNGFDSLLIKVSIALSLNLARLTRMVEAYHRVTSMRQNGFAARLQGLARAEFALGTLYHVGHGVPQNYLEAAKWYRRAADQGFESAQYNLGGMYYLGLGVPKALVSAQMYFYLAAARGHEEARKVRDDLEKQMTAAQIRAAQKRADEWKPKSSTYGQGAQ